MLSTQNPNLPFGKHKNKPLAEVPADYLLWALRECKLSSGLRLAVGNELRRRNVEAPAPPAIKPPPDCDRCHSDRFHVGWMEDRAGRRRIRASCSCGRFLTFLPQVEPWLSLADRNASETAILDAMTRLEDLGVELASDGKRVWFQGDDYRLVPPDLKAVIRQCSNQLARLIGNNQLQVTT